MKAASIRKTLSTKTSKEGEGVVPYGDDRCIENTNKSFADAHRV